MVEKSRNSPPSWSSLYTNEGRQNINELVYASIVRSVTEENKANMEDKESRNMGVLCRKSGIKRKTCNISRKEKNN